ncbi:MAG: alpha/beta hydrolase [Acidobacteriaceae bacterium]
MQSAAVVQHTVVLILGAVAIYAVASTIVGVVLVERALHLPREDELDKSSLKSPAIVQEVASIDDASVTALDGCRLVGWYVRPVHDNGSAVILLHGAGHDRVRVEKQALVLLRHGYRVLMPDSRGQGQSEGRLTTFGVEESDDVQRWVSWLQEYDAPKCTYGYGQSMGALILLRSLAVEKRFCAVVADSCPISFVEAGYDLIGRATRFGPWVGRSVGRGPMEIAIFYSRFRYGVDLADASAESGLRHSAVPVLLVQGTVDQKVPPRHVGRLSSCTCRAEVWCVPGAGHSAAIDVASSEYETRLVSWFTRDASRRPTRSEQRYPVPSAVVSESSE